MSLLDNLLQKASVYAKEAEELEEKNPEEAFVAASQAAHLYDHVLIEFPLLEEGQKASISQCSALHHRWVQKLRAQSYDNYGRRQTTDSLDNMTPSPNVDSEFAKLKQKYLSRLRVSGKSTAYNVVGLGRMKKIFTLTGQFLQAQTSGKEKSQETLRNINILLFGLAGTGKTYSVYAHHNQIPNCSLIELTPVDLMSKYYGEGESNLKAAVEVAKEHSPAIIFIDEIDGIFKSREIAGGSANSSLLTQLLILANQCEGIQIIAATNKPELLDKALLRRFGYILHVPLPSSLERKQMLQNVLGKECNLTEADIERLASETSGFSTSDIAQLITRARQDMLMKAEESTWFNETKSSNGCTVWIPCDSATPGAVSKCLDEIAVTEWSIWNVGMENITKALEHYSKTTNDDETGRQAKKNMREFLVQHGEDADDGQSYEEDRREKLFKSLKWQPIVYDETDIQNTSFQWATYAMNKDSGTQTDWSELVNMGYARKCAIENATPTPLKKGSCVIN